MESQSDLAIRTEGLVKVFGKVRALDGVDLTVPEGMVYGFLGPNGAGKTTAIRTLATLLKPDEGTARVFGYDVMKQPEEVRRVVSLTGQFASVDEALTGAENLVLVARLLGHSWAESRKRANVLLEAFGIDYAGDRLTKNYSGGMRRRLDIAASIIVSPKLLFLDEPTAGLDPQGRNQVWDAVRALVAVGTTVLLTTQYLEEADALVGRIAVIDHGKIIAEGTPNELKASVGSGAVQVRLFRAEDRPKASELLAEALGVPVELASDPLAISARANDPEQVAAALVMLSRSGIRVADYALGQPSLDEVFLALTGHKVDVSPGSEAGNKNEEVAV
ncbi:caunorubicin/doxorubicin resistance ATP-binding protein [Prauserella marina]|uniref:ATP-binding cassette domain-containing protein n=1 Tax=Prauserella marina TaxID=530584 RepID=UPI000B8D258B|nr:ATP-binding cassette domain-containing protein [Prauserella marina]ASR34868.1 caunorubicin/doxorubicin resistance ATP-binding protein [Prauserella marina]